MADTPDEYASYVDHPRYGRGPRVTGLNPSSFFLSGRFFHWRSTKDSRISNTAIPADVKRQAYTTIAVTHYFDERHECRDCKRPFIFFAEEQKYWYEELGIALDTDCVRCVPCRKRRQEIARKRKRYEELFRVPDRTTEQDLEMAECCLSLIEASVFGRGPIQHIRRALKRVNRECDAPTQSRCQEIRARVVRIETEDDGESAGEDIQ